MKTYMLVARNSCGATVTYYGNTIKSVKNKFKNEYETKGFKITITLLNQ